jgi:RNase H-fold protein (predicted Holliday junction resolvase)
MRFLSVSDSKQSLDRILAVDPGRDKCGVAVVQTDGLVLYQAVVPTKEIGPQVARLTQEHRVGTLLLGDRTAAKEVGRLLSQATGALRPVVVDEHRSTEEGRRRYFRENPRRGWRRLLPVSLQTPPRPYDDYVAVVLAERYLSGKRDP